MSSPSNGGSDQSGATPQQDRISFDDFTKVQMRVGRVLEAANHPNADKLVVLKVDLGQEQRQLCAGLRRHYETADLVGRNIVVVTNLAPRKMRGVESDGMLLAASSPDRTRVILLEPSEDVAPGAEVS
jgi:methionyl-tRNA synthetase